MWSTKISGGAHPGQAETSQVLRNVAWNTLYFAINLSREKSESLKKGRNMNSTFSIGSKS